MMFARYKKGESNGMMILMMLGMLSLIGIVVSWAVYIFLDDDKTLRLVASGFTSAFSLVITITAVVYGFMEGFMMGPMSDDGEGEGKTEIDSSNIGNRFVQHPSTARVLCTLYFVSACIYIVIESMIDKLDIGHRDPATVGLSDADKELLHKEDQWHNIMFFSSIVIASHPNSFARL